MQEFIKYGEKKGASFVELKSLESKNTGIQIVNKDVKDITQGRSRIFSARVIFNGFEGLAYSDNPDFKKIIDKAISVSRIMNKKADHLVVPGIKKKVITSFEIDPETINLEEKKETLLRLANRSGFKKINSVELYYADAVKKYNIVNSEGADLEWDDVSTGLFATAYAKEGTNIEKHMTVIREHQGYESMNDAENKVNEACKIAEELLKADEARAGNFPVIVDHELGGTFTHEAVGHACEADLAMQGSVLKGKIGKKIGSSILNIADDGTVKKWGWLPFDDEGTETQRTIIVENGVLVSYIHSKETAAMMNARPTGNGRAEGPYQRIIPRMTNTFILPGKDKFEGMIKSVKNGYYLKGTKGGQVDTNKGEFLFNSNYGYEIKNGELGKMVKHPSLTGNILEILPRISMIANKLDYGAGTCGKNGQAVPVGDGSPSFKIDLARVGGSK